MSNLNELIHIKLHIWSIQYTYKVFNGPLNKNKTVEAIFFFQALVEIFLLPMYQNYIQMQDITVLKLPS